jgi:TolB-like protein/Flp pilus assembly protein TadD
MSEEPAGFQAFLAEIKRRRVVRIALIYGAVAFGVLQGADIVVPAMQLPGWVLSLLVAIALVGFPITIALSWLYDLTPEGIVRTGADATTADRSTGWLSSGTVIILGGVAVAITAGWWLTRATGVAAPGAEAREAIRSIAVLPFANVGDDPGDQYFSDGLADELRSLLARVGGLDVAARASSVAAHEQAAESFAIGGALSVAAVLKGTVDKEGDRVRVSAQLSSTEPNSPDLWNAEYDRLIDDVFDVQEEIAQSIVEALRLRLPDDGSEVGEEIVTTNSMAYDKYLWGRFNLNRDTPAGVAAAIDNYRMSIGFDSTFAPAWTGLAESYARGLEFPEALDPSEGITQGMIASEEAVRIDPESVDARTALGLLHARSYDWAAASTQLERAVEEDPSSPTAHMRYAEVLMALGQGDLAVAEIRAAERVDMLSWRVKLSAARMLAATGRIDDAIRSTQEALALASENTRVWTEMAFLFLAAARFEDALDTFQRLAELIQADPALAEGFVAAAQAFADDGAAVEIAGGIEIFAEGRAEAWAMYLAAAGQVPEALLALRTAIDRHTPGVTTVLRLPALAPVRSDPGFADLLVVLGLAG